MAEEEETGSAGPAASCGEPARCSGALADLAVADVLQLLQLIGKSAVMTVTVAHRGAHSRLWCSEGSLIDAESGRLRGEAAAYRILALDDGWLEAELRHEPRARTIFAPTQRLLLEAARRKDETLALKHKLGDDRCCYRLVHEPEPEQLVSPNAAELRLLRLLTSTASVAELLADSELGDLETLGALERWFEAGYLARVGTRLDVESYSTVGTLFAATRSLDAGASRAGAPLPAPSPSALPSDAALSPAAAADTVAPLEAALPDAPPLPSVPPLVASVPPQRQSPRAQRLALLAAGAALLALASFAGGYLLHGDAPGSLTRGAAGQPPAGAQLSPPERVAGSRKALAQQDVPGQASAGSTVAAAEPSNGVAEEAPLGLPPVGPDAEGNAAENAAALSADQVSPSDAQLPAPEAPAPQAPAAQASSAGLAGGQSGGPAVAARATAAAKPAARAARGRAGNPPAGRSPVISEPRVRVIGVSEPSVRLLD